MKAIDPEGHKKSGNGRAALGSICAGIVIFILSYIWLFTIGMGYYDGTPSVYSELGVFQKSLSDKLMFTIYVSAAASVCLILGGALLFLKKWLLLSYVGISLAYFSLACFLSWSVLMTAAARDLLEFAAFLVLGFFFAVPVALLHRGLRLIN